MPISSARLNEIQGAWNDGNGNTKAFQKALAAAVRSGEVQKEGLQEIGIAWESADPKVFAAALKKWETIPKESPKEKPLELVIEQSDFIPGEVPSGGLQIEQAPFVPRKEKEKSTRTGFARLLDIPSEFADAFSKMPGQRGNPDWPSWNKNKIDESLLRARGIEPVINSSSRNYLEEDKRNISPSESTGSDIRGRINRADALYALADARRNFLEISSSSGDKATRPFANALYSYQEAIRDASMAGIDPSTLDEDEQEYLAAMNKIGATSPLEMKDGKVSGKKTSQESYLIGKQPLLRAHIRGGKSGAIDVVSGALDLPTRLLNAAVMGDMTALNDEERYLADDAVASWIDENDWTATKLGKEFIGRLVSDPTVLASLPKAAGRIAAAAPEGAKAALKALASGSTQLATKDLGAVRSFLRTFGDEGYRAAATERAAQNVVQGRRTIPSGQVLEMTGPTAKGKLIDRVEPMLSQEGRVHSETFQQRIEPFMQTMGDAEGSAGNTLYNELSGIAKRTSKFSSEANIKRTNITEIVDSYLKDSTGKGFSPISASKETQNSVDILNEAIGDVLKGIPADAEARPILTALEELTASGDLKLRKISGKINLYANDKAVEELRQASRKVFASGKDAATPAQRNLNVFSGSMNAVRKERMAQGAAVIAKETPEEVSNALGRFMTDAEKKALQEARYPAERQQIFREAYDKFANEWEDANELAKIIGGKIVRSKKIRNLKDQGRREISENLRKYIQQVVNDTSASSVEEIEGWNRIKNMDRVYGTNFADDTKAAWMVKKYASENGIVSTAGNKSSRISDIVWEKVPGAWEDWKADKTILNGFYQLVNGAINTAKEASAVVLPFDRDLATADKLVTFIETASRTAPFSGTGKGGVISSAWTKATRWNPSKAGGFQGPMDLVFALTVSPGSVAQAISLVKDRKIAQSLSKALPAARQASLALVSSMKEDERRAAFGDEEAKQLSDFIKERGEYAGGGKAPVSDQAGLAAPGAASSESVDEGFRKVIGKLSDQSVSETLGISPREFYGLYAAIQPNESGANPNIGLHGNASSATGVLGFTDKTFDDVSKMVNRAGISMDEFGGSAYSPGASMMAAAALWGDELKHYGGDIRRVIASHHEGREEVDKRIRQYGDEWLDYPWESAKELERKKKNKTDEKVTDMIAYIKKAYANYLKAADKLSEESKWQQTKEIPSKAREAGLRMPDKSTVGHAVNQAIRAGLNLP